MKKAFILLFTILHLNCAAPMTTYEYADGNGNVFVISAATLEYRPVKRAESSSGFYSGGEPKIISLTDDQFFAIQRVFNNAIENSSMHIANRVMMSGSITVINDDRKEFILKPGAQELMEIDSTLRKAIRN